MAMNIANIRPGDTLLVRCTAGPGFCAQRPLVYADSGAFSSGTFMPPVGAIVQHTPAALRVGSVVTRDPKGNTRGVIKHVIDGHAWVDWSSGQRLVHQIDALEAIPAESGLSDLAAQPTTSAPATDDHPTQATASNQAGKEE